VKHWIKNREGSWSVAVIVPARNEGNSIVCCVESIIGSAAYRPLRGFWIVVVADSCNDNTVQQARDTLGCFGEVVTCSVRSAGMARRLGVAAALSHFSDIDPNQLWLANTDADTFVPREWLANHLRFADDGIAAVAGIVKIDAVPGHSDELARAIMSDYAIASDGSHTHVHGANLGVRADAYLDAGGWSHLAVSEDHCLWRRLGLRGWAMAASAHSIVVTSGRLQGQARGGFADLLRRKLECLNGST